MNHKFNPKTVFLTLTLLGAALLLGGLSVFAHAAAGEVQPLIPPIWMEGAPLIQPYGGGPGVQCAGDPDGFYLLGGVIGSPWVDTDRVFHFDAATNMWQELASMPQAIRATASACYDGKIYVAGGYSYPSILNTFYIYDVATNTWSSGPDLPRYVWGAALGAWHGKIYLAGGTASMSPYTPVTTVNIYDIDTGNWKITPGPSMLVGTSFSGYVQAGPYLYVVGGFSGDLTNNVTATQRFDMSTQTWTLGPEFVSGRALLGLAVTGQSLYAMGGDQNGDGTPFNFTDLVERLDHTQWPAGVWEEAFSPLPIIGAGNAGFCTEAIASGEIWSVGGNSVITDTNFFHAAEPCFTLNGLTLTPETAAQEGLPGETVTYTLNVTNTGYITDTYDLTVSAVWTTIVPATVGPLAPGDSTTFQVLVTIPGDAVFFDADTALITATSQGDPNESDTASLTTSVPEYWVEAAPIPHEVIGGRGELACLDDPNRFYVLGGMDISLVPLNLVWRYDASTNSWDPLENLPTPLHGPAALCYQGKLYVAGGRTPGGGPSTAFFIYDIATDMWTSGQPLPRPAQAAGLGAWDGKLFLVGGLTTPDQPVNQVDIYDIGTNTWIANAGTPMPVAVYSAGRAQTGPYLWFAGGWTDDLNNNLDTTQRYDMSTGTWSVQNDFSSRRAGLAMAVTGSYLYAMGGDTNGGGQINLTDQVEFLDYLSWPDTSWLAFDDSLPLAMNGNEGYCTEVVAGGEIYSVGGLAYINPSYIALDYNFVHPAEPCLSFDLLLQPETLDGVGMPGTRVDYLLTITNTSSITDYLSIEATGLWTVTYPTTTGPLGPGQSMEFEVNIDIPSSAMPGEMNTTTVLATSISDPAKSATATLTTSVSPYAVTFTPTEATGSNYVGETVHYMLLLKNMGSVTDTFTLEFTGNSWTITPAFTETTLGPGAGIELSIFVSIPVNAADGAADSLTLIAVSTGNPTQTATVTLTTTAIWYKQYLPVIKY